MKSNEYEEFMAQYKKDHEVCPKCGSVGGSCTYVGYIFNSNKPNDYKDLNNYTCSKCKNTHKVHDRISKEEFNETIRKKTTSS